MGFPRNHHDRNGEQMYGYRWDFERVQGTEGKCGQFEKTSGQIRAKYHNGFFLGEGRNAGE